MGKSPQVLCSYCEKPPLLDDVYLTGERRCVTGRDAEDCPQYQTYLESLDSDKDKSKHGRRRKK